MTSEGIFENIAERIEEEINKSQKDIYLAVAWFTNKNLFNSLVKKSQEGVKVILVISDNEINRNSSIIYNDIQKGESKLFCFLLECYREQHQLRMELLSVLQQWLFE